VPFAPRIVCILGKRIKSEEKRIYGGVFNKKALTS